MSVERNLSHYAILHSLEAEDRCRPAAPPTFTASDPPLEVLSNGIVLYPFRGEN